MVRRLAEAARRQPEAVELPPPAPCARSGCPMPAYTPASSTYGRSRGGIESSGWRAKSASARSGRRRRVPDPDVARRQGQPVEQVVTEVAILLLGVHRRPAVAHRLRDPPVQKRQVGQRLVPVSPADRVVRRPVRHEPGVTSGGGVVVLRDGEIDLGVFEVEISREQPVRPVERVASLRQLALIDEHLLEPVPDDHDGGVRAHGPSCRTPPSGQGPEIGVDVGEVIERAHVGRVQLEQGQVGGDGTIVLVGHARIVDRRGVGTLPLAEPVAVAKRARLHLGGAPVFADDAVLDPQPDQRRGEGAVQRHRLLEQGPSLCPVRLGAQDAGGLREEPERLKRGRGHLLEREPGPDRPERLADPGAHRGRQLARARGGVASSQRRSRARRPGPRPIRRRRAGPRS